MSIFNKADILLPHKTELEKWSVVACDQYTSQPSYWERVKKNVGGAPSSLNIIYPEAFLSEGEKRISEINRTMDKYIADGVFKEYKNCLIYIERTLSGKRRRRGIIGAADLEEYDFAKGSHSAIRATEGTVLERIPPRVKIRENAPLELPHAILLINDEKDAVFSAVVRGEKLYDFELMEGGGHLEGWLIQNADEVIGLLDSYAGTAKDGLAYAVGDGNHSLATAKTCWENLKCGLGAAERGSHPARYCLTEIENIHDSALEFEPIHRAVFGVTLADALEKLKGFYKTSETAADGAQRICYVQGETEGEIYVTNPPSNLTVGTLQKFIDSMGWQVDYIHGGDEVRRLAREENAVGFLLPAPSKNELFETVIKDGALPRKTFSMGEANEKRFYLEAKKIK